MTLDELQLICELPNYSSFADASFYIPYSPATITKYVNNVEEELGIKIFIRSNKSHSLRLTEEGETIISSLMRINDDYLYLKRQVSQLKSLENNHLRIGSQPRLGNTHEQMITASFLLQNLTAQVSMHKGTADELIRGLIIGNIDVALITFNKNISLSQYFGENRPRLEATFLASEPDMYVGVSEENFPDESEIHMKDLENFTMAFPFPESTDLQSSQALRSWQTNARMNNMTLRYINLQGYDNTVFEMARTQGFAITTTNIPSVNYPGVHFLKVCDWVGGNDLYMVRRRGQVSEALRQFEQVALEHCSSLPANMSRAAS